MNDWTEGYVSDIGYTFGYYPELNPARIKLAFLNNGLVFPEVGAACELGYGQGMSVNLHAAASVVEWHGTDFNPSHAGFALELAEAAGSQAQLQDTAFADFCSRSDLPDFDFIGLHGIWSWISDANRSAIADFVRRKLKVGGVLYVSYNTLPGWSGTAPIRRLLAEHAETMGTSGEGAVGRMNSALDFVGNLLSSNPLYAAANPNVPKKFESLKSQSRSYLVHEYLNRDWHPMYFGDVVRWLGPTKLTFACSANYLDHIDALNLTGAQQTLLGGIPDPMFRQGVRDFVVNQQFRRDYWVKGPRKLSQPEQSDALRAQRVVMVTYRPDVSLKVAGPLGEASLNDVVYNPILDALADGKVRTIGEIEQEIAGKGIGFGQLVQAVMALCGTGALESAQEESVIAATRAQTAAINRHLVQKARGSGDVRYLASPVTGGGVMVDRFGQLCLLARAQGITEPDGWAEFCWSVLDAQGQKLLKDGKPLEQASENLAELKERVRAFAEKRLPVLAALQVL